jgi:hypothetical protein
MPDEAPVEVDTFEALKQALQAHVGARTGGDLVTGFVVIAAIYDHDDGFKTSHITTSPLAFWEIKGLLTDGLDQIAALSTGGD